MIVSKSLLADRSVKRPISPMHSKVNNASMPLAVLSFNNNASIVAFVANAPAAMHTAAAHFAKLCATN